MSKTHIPRPPPPLSPWQQEQAATLIRSVRERLLAEDSDIAEDPDLWRDMLDGESDVIDLIRNLVRASIDADLLAEAIRKRQTEIAERAERAERRKQAFRAAAMGLMDLAIISKLPAPDFTARVQPGQPHLGSLDLDALPSDYVDVEVTVTRRPLKDRLLAALKAGHAIPGAQLRPGTPFIVINRKEEPVMNTITKVPPAVDASLVTTPVATPGTPSTAPSSLAPATFAELIEFAEIAARSNFVPKDYRGHPEDILLAVQLGSEVGLRPLQALQNISVINGRPAIWGDAMPALCKASAVYQDLVETWEREDDADFLAAVCVAKRHGSTPVTVRFSVIDAKKAGLWTKLGPWQTYPRRMLQLRARSFALRDAFPDVLKGLISAEEALDLPGPPDRLPPAPTIDAAPEPPPPTLSPEIDRSTEATTASPAANPTPEPPADTVYRLQTKQGVTVFKTGEEWLSTWAKIVRGCKAANALDKLQTARDANAAYIAAVATFDPEPAATLTSELDRAFVTADAPL